MAGTRFNWQYAVQTNASVLARFLYLEDATAAAEVLRTLYPHHTISVVRKEASK